MHHFFALQEPDSNGIIFITGPDVNHIRNVLRMREGGELAVMTAKDHGWLCRIVRIEPDEVELEAVSEIETCELPGELDLFQGIPKADKMEFIIQKAVELGAHSVIPVQMHRSVARIDDKKKDKKLQRWSAISESAAKQSGRGVIPEIGPVCSMKEAVGMAAYYDLIIVPYENEEGMQGTARVLSELKPGVRAAIFVGPEGGFEPDEIELLKGAGASVISLGRRILRTETAGLVTLAWCMLKLES